MSHPNADLWWVDLKYAYFGVLVGDCRVVWVAPIMHWANGKTWGKVTAWIKSKGGTFGKVV